MSTRKRGFELLGKRFGVLASLSRAASIFIVATLSFLSLQPAPSSGVQISVPVENLECFGAAAHAPNRPACSNPAIQGLFPPISKAFGDGGINRELCGSMSRADSVPKVCILGVKAAPTVIGVIGDSHIIPYVATLSKLAAKHNWRLEVYWKGGCPFSDAQRVHDEVLSKTCKRFVEISKRRILAARYDLLITTQVSGVDWVPGVALNSEITAENGLVSLWYEIVKTGTSVLAIKDNPRPIPKVLECLSKKGLNKCNHKRSSAFRHDPQVSALARLGSKKVSLVNFDNIYCRPSFCDAVIGNVIVYRDANHITSTFAKTLAPYLLPHIRNALAG